jgi:(R,R)-butanediol dehydrogenase / meso-butanediol dehydrogenase / diacetyl reductase
MLQVQVHGPGDVRVDKVDPPVPGPRDVTVRVTACGVCGSDVSYVRLGGVAGPTGRPMPLGHEIAGVVEQVGAEVTGVAAGDRVVVHPGDDELGRIGNGAPEGGLTPLLLVREAARGGRVFPVPDAVPTEVAALAEPVAVGMHAVDQADVQPGEAVAVFGCGPIGLAAVATLVDRGIDRVVAIDLSPTRLDLAQGLGAQAVLDPTEVDVWDELARLHGTAPFMLGPTPATDAFIEASGSPRVLTEVLERGRVGGRMSVVALHYDPVPTSYLLLLMKQFTIRGSMEYPPRFEDAIDLLARRDLSALVTHRVPLVAFDDALALVSGSRHAGKVLVTMEHP